MSRENNNYFNYFYFIFRSVSLDIFDKVCDRIEEEPTPGYSPSLTEYFLLMLLIFTVVLVYKAVKAFFISPKKKK